MFFFDTWQLTHLKNLIEGLNWIKIKVKKKNWIDWNQVSKLNWTKSKWLSKIKRYNL